MKNSNIGVSAIVCAYNEEKTIQNVITMIIASDRIDELIIVNDGSIDQTDKIIRKLSETIPLTYVKLNKNKGKGYAMAIGANKAKNDIIFYIDADHSVEDLDCIDQILDVFFLDGLKSKMVLGYTTVKIAGKSVNPMKILTGERVLLKSNIRPLFNKMKKSRFGVETLLFMYYKSERIPVEFTHLENLKHLTKFHKSSVINASKSYIFEGYEIISTAICNSNLILKGIIKSNSNSKNNAKFSQ